MMLKSIVYIKRHKAMLYVFGSNIISLVIGAFLSFFIPYLLKVEQFGYYKQFTLYLSYIGLLHFGFNDGIYLEYGSYNYKDLNKVKFRMYFHYLFLQQVFTAFILLVVVYVLFKGNNRLFVFGSVILNMVLLNIMKYFSYISQVTKRFSLYSIAYLVEKTFLFIPLLLLFVLDIKTFYYVVISQTLINSFLIILFINVYKDLVFGKREKHNRKEIKKIVGLGLSLMLGNFIIIMIFNIDRLMIDWLLSIKAFSIYSLAVNFLSIILVFVSSLAMILYPYLKRKNTKDYKSYYQKMSYITSIFTTLSLATFFPIRHIITEYLPQYKESIPLFLILLPGVALRGEIDVVFNNIFKALKKQRVYFIIAIIIFTLSIALNITFYYFYHSLFAFAYATLITFILWYILSDIYLIKYFKVFHLKKYVYLLLSYGLYIICTNISNWIISSFIYVFVLILFLFILHFKHLKLNKPLYKTIFVE